jgi:hypothetical protein
VPVPPLSDQLAITKELDPARAQLVAAVRKVERYQRMRSELVEALLSGQLTVPDRVLLKRDLAAEELIS